MYVHARCKYLQWLLCMQITGDLNDEYLIMSMISRHDQSVLST